MQQTEYSSSVELCKKEDEVTAIESLKGGFSNNRSNMFSCNQPNISKIYAKSLFTLHNIASLHFAARFHVYLGSITLLQHLYSVTAPDVDMHWPTLGWKKIFLVLYKQLVVFWLVITSKSTHFKIFFINNQINFKLQHVQHA